MTGLDQNHGEAGASFSRTRWLLRLQLGWLLLGLIAVGAFRLHLLAWRPAVQLAALSLAGLVLIGCASLLALFLLLRARRAEGSRAALLAAILSLPALIGTLMLGLQAARAPLIHDISTDTDNPPRFLSAPSLRTNGDNSLEYPGTAVALQQRQAYADIVPLILAIPPARAYERSLAVAERLGWTITDRRPEQGMIEAKDHSRIFGFVDDIVIRITATAGGSRVDCRSASRAGVSDLGVNAKRIRVFLRAVDASSKE